MSGWPFADVTLQKWKLERSPRDAHHYVPGAQTSEEAQGLQSAFMFLDPLVMKNIFLLMPLLLFAALPVPLLAGQDTADGEQHGRHSLTLTKTSTPPVLDGRLDDAAWRDSEIIGNFIQKDPEEGMPASERTEVRALFDEQNLYFGVSCQDAQAERILATELRRDNSFENDDSFAVILDTFHDHRNSFLFRINPQGTQFDALITDEGRDRNVSWDEKWEVETRIDENGWYAEIKIPLKSLRFASNQEETHFGVDFERIIRRKNEFSYWNNFNRDFQFEQVSQAGHLRGLGGVGRNLRMRIKPSIGSRIVTQGSTDRDTSYLGDVGLEDLKLPLTSGLTLDLTLNTDFAQTEVDDQVI
ncbi:MAG: carbohydrate binding family 9 domain-containing protein, partial [Acidobacteriota bacterium]